MIPTPPSHRAADHGLNDAVDWPQVARELHGLNVLSSPRALKSLSKDFHWYSPVLVAELRDCVADLVVKVSTEADVMQVAAVAARHRLPLTVRGGGTGNYGQCVPLAGGVVLDVTGMQRVLDIAPGRVRVQGGARIHDIEMAVRETGQTLRMWPSTWRLATIGGFIAGGFGGVGSLRHGMLRDAGNLLRCRVMTVEHEPRVIELVGDEIQKVHHAYGTNGIITEVELALERGAWNGSHVIALFDGYDTARAGLRRGGAGRQLDALPADAVERRFSPYYPALAALLPARPRRASSR